MVNNKEFQGLTELEIVKLINKRKKRYCAMALNDLEEEIHDPELFKKVRKIVLDNMNGFTRSIFTVVGISVEGIEEE
ncbi:MAG: hypothetical protein WC196_06385 [Bacilli bacterium]|jgi:hypothetical protein